jgi:hypothetical protein
MKIDNPILLGQSSGFGIPTAGTSGQVLTKINSTDYNTRWSDAKSVTYNIVESCGTTWVNLGRWTTTQTGKLLRITVMSHVGYNANPTQPQVTELVLDKLRHLPLSTLQRFLSYVPIGIRNQLPASPYREADAACIHHLTEVLRIELTLNVAHKTLNALGVQQ